MIKTVSFAPPRASSPRSASAATSGPAKPRKTGGRAASGSSSTQTTLSFSFDDEPAPLPEPAPVKTATPVKAEKKTPTKTVAKTPVKAEKAKVQPKAPSNISFAKKTLPKPDKPPLELKGKKVRAPKDLAVQYGGAAEERPHLPLALEPDSPKKRLTKVQREARKTLIKPDEGLLERLARASQIPTVKAKSEPRGKGWRFLCGRCGNTSFFQTPAGLCACGAIALKD